MKIPSHFLSINSYCAIYDKRASSVYATFYLDRKKNRKDRFIEFNSKIYVDINYPFTKKEKEELEKAQNLYYKVLSYYRNDYDLSVALSKHISVRQLTIYQRLRDFKFTKTAREMLEGLNILYLERKKEIDEACICI